MFDHHFGIDLLTPLLKFSACLFCLIPHTVGYVCSFQGSTWHPAYSLQLDACNGWRCVEKTILWRGQSSVFPTNWHHRGQDEEDGASCQATLFWKSFPISIGAARMIDCFSIVSDVFLMCFPCSCAAGANRNFLLARHSPNIENLTMFSPVRRKCFRMKQTEGSTYYCMAIGKPLAIDNGLLDRMLFHLRCRHAGRLKERMVSEHMLAEEGNCLKFMISAFSDVWLKYCLIRRCQAAWRCSCWMHTWRGSCVHVFSVQEYSGFRLWRQPIPIAQESDQPAVDPRDASEEEPQEPRRKRRRQ